ncbi:MAG TPA: hypothetical protein PLO67_07705, partial [Saprospiraceae bacterium]|nr:hypothetical protein [Saprospiraceae bacterium]
IGNEISLEGDSMLLGEGKIVGEDSWIAFEGNLNAFKCNLAPLDSFCHVRSSIPSHNSSAAPPKRLRPAANLQHSHALIFVTKSS